MKTKVLKLCIILMLFFVGAGCEKNELDFADEDIVVGTYPWLSVYKTKGNYIDFVSFQLKNGNISGIPGIKPNSHAYEYDKDGNLKAKYRYLLRCGYTVGDGNEHTVYTDITFKEYLEKDMVNYPVEKLKARIIDTEPFIKFYYIITLVSLNNC